MIRRSLFASVLVTSLLAPLTSFAYYTTMDTAELVDSGKYNLNLETQFITDGEDGLNLIGHFDGRLTNDSGYRVELGFGVVDYQIGAYYKWAPIPDTGNQPAVSVSGGVSLARYTFNVGHGLKDDFTDLSIRGTPIVSKKFAVEFGSLVPYASLPLGIRTIDGDSDLTAQLAIGTFVIPSRFEKMSFTGEIGFDLEDAFTYISLGFNLNVDPEAGLEFR